MTEKINFDYKENKIYVIFKSVQMVEDNNVCYNHLIPIGFTNNEQKAEEITSTLADYLQSLEDKVSSLRIENKKQRTIELFLLDNGFSLEEFENLNGYTYRELKEITQLKIY